MKRPSRSLLLARVLIAAGLSGLSAVGCTKVREQPDPPPSAAPAAPAPAPARPAARPPSSASGFAASAPIAETPPLGAARIPGPPDAAAVPAAPAAGTLNGDPKGLRNEDLQKALGVVMPKLAACLAEGGGGAGTDIMLTVEADSTGSARDVNVQGKADLPQKVTTCLSAAAAAMTFPKFEGKAVKVSVPLAIHGAPSPSPSPSRSAAAAPAPTPPAGDQQPRLFMTP